MRFLYCHEITGILFCLRQKGFATEARRHKGFALGKKENCHRNTEARPAGRSDGHRKIQVLFCASVPLWQINSRRE